MSGGVAGGDAGRDVGAVRRVETGEAVGPVTPMDNTWQSGFRSQRAEIRNAELDVEGRLPEWLDGTFLVDGPGQFEVGETPLAHWFDALALLRRVRIADGGATYAARFVRSEDFRVAREHGRVRRPLPGTPASGRPLGRLRRTLSGLQDNPAIGVLRIDGTVYAVSETPIGIAVDPETLATVGRRDLTAGLDADATLGHCHVVDGVQWGLATSVGRECVYTLFRRSPGESPEPITRLRFGTHPPYVHSFALTERYAVVPEAPFGVDFRRLLLGAARGRTFADCVAPRDEPARFHVLDRTTGDRVAAVRGDPFFIYHFANAYEDDDAIVADCVRFDDERAITALTVANLRSDDPNVPRGDLVRYRLPLSGGSARRELLCPGPASFPTVDYRRVNGRPYRYVYLVATEYGGLPTAVAKVDLERGTVRRWSEPGVHPGEATFVPAPSGTAEDDGVLLSLALDGAADRSALLCLDAETLTERARLPLPHRVPYGFHGQFLATDDPGRSMA